MESMNEKSSVAPRFSVGQKLRTSLRLAGLAVAGLFAGSVAEAAAPTFGAASQLEANFPSAPVGVIGSSPFVGNGRSLDFRGNGGRTYAYGSRGTGINFGVPASTVLTTQLRDWAVADLNADGKPDLVLIDSGTLSILLNTNNGTNLSFATPVDFSGNGLERLAVGDIDGDGDLDVVAGTDSSSATANGTGLFWYLNSGATGGYTFSEGGSLGVSLPNVKAIAAGPLSGAAAGDASAEVVVVGQNAIFSDGLILKWSGSGLVLTGGSVTFSKFVRELRIADVTNDGKNDLAAATQSSVETAPGVYTNETQLDILRNRSGEDDGMGGAVPVDTLGSSEGFLLSSLSGETMARSVPVEIAVADFNGDGKQELAATVVTSGDSGFVRVLQFSQEIVAGFVVLTVDHSQATTAGFSDKYPTALGTADLNGDGRMDLLVSGFGETTGGVELVSFPNTSGGAPVSATLSVAGPLAGVTGQDLAYTFTATNTGAATLSDVKIEAWLPAGTTRVSATTPSSTLLGTGAETAVEWSIASIAAGGTASRTLTLRASAPVTFASSAFDARAYLKKTGTGTVDTVDFPATQIVDSANAIAPAAKFVVSAGGKTGHSIGDQFATWKFEAEQRLNISEPGLALRVQSSPDGTVWADVAGGTLARSKPTATKWTGAFPMPLAGGSYFLRVVSSAPGKTDGTTQAAGIYLVNGKPRIEFTVTRNSQVDPQGTTTRPGDIVRYDVTVRNTGSVDAASVVVTGPVPLEMRDPVGSSMALSTGGTFPALLLRDNRGNDFSVVWSIPNLAVNATGTANYSCIVEEAAPIGKKIGPFRLAAFYDALPVTDYASAIRSGIAAGLQKKYFVLPDSGVPVATVNSGLFMKVTPGTGIAPIGGTVTYTVTVQNLKSESRPEAVVNVRIPRGMQFESYGAQSGINFNGAAQTSISSGTNPKLVRPTFDNPGVIEWTLGNMAARENRTLVFTCRIGADLRDTVINPDLSTSPNELAVYEYNFRTGGGRKPFYAFPRPTITDTEPVALATLTQPPVRTLLTLPSAAGLPQLAVSKESVGENDGFITIEGVETPTVVSEASGPGAHQITQIIRVTNRGGVAARNVQVVDVIAPQVVFDSNVEINGNSPLVGAVKLFDAKSREITQSFINGDSRRVFQANSVLFNVGDVAPNTTTTVQYKIRPATVVSRDIFKPAKDPVALKVGTIFPNPAPTVFSGSFVQPILCPNTDPQCIVVSPVSLAIDMYPTKAGAVLEEDFAFDTVIRNNGGGAASNVSFRGYIPTKFASYVETVFINTVTGAQTVATGAVLKRLPNNEVAYATVGVPTINGNSSIIVSVKMRIKPGAQIPANLKTVDATAQFNAEVVHASVAPLREPITSGALTTIGKTAAEISGLINVDALPFAPRPVVKKDAPASIREGEVMPITMTVANHGGSAVEGGVLAIIIPEGSDIVETGPVRTTAGFKKKGSRVEWQIPSVAGQGQGVFVRQLAVRLRKGVKRPNFRLLENSCVFSSTNAGEIAPAATSTLVTNTNEIVGALQFAGDAIGSFFQGVGRFFFGSGTVATNTAEAALSQLRSAGTVSQIAGADFLTIGNTTVIPMGGDRVLAFGPSANLTAPPASIVAGGAGNFIAGGGIVAAGAGNLLANDGGGFTAAQLTSLVVTQQANVVAAGAGNLISKDGSKLLANDGGGFVSVQFRASNIVAAGGGNIIAAGAGNIVAAGGGNIVAAGGGNIVAGGAGNVIANPGSAALAVTVLPSGSMVGGTAQRLANGNPTANIVAGGAGNFTSTQAGNIVAGGAGN
jgi:uncharacterized repeat protein (TIGR01451 family)